MVSYNPAILSYIGGYGRASDAIGKSMSDIGQAKLDLEDQKKKNDISNAMLTLSQNADTRAADAVKQAIADKAETKQSAFDKNLASNEYLYSAMGKTLPAEMSNERAQLGLMDPDIIAKTMKANGKEYKGTYNGVDGNRYVEWSDGTSTPMNGGAKPFIDKAFNVGTQYVGGKPTLVGTSLLSGNQNSVALPGVTDNEYNARLSSGLSLANTLTSQANSAKLGLDYSPLVADAKNTVEVENTLKTLAASGFTEEVSPGQAAFYEKKTPDGSTLNLQSIKINGVTKYFTKPGNIYTRPKK